MGPRLARVMARDAAEAGLASLDADASRRLARAIEHQRSDFLSHGRVPEDPRTGASDPD